MSRCWLEGEWRAYLDRELPADDMVAAGQHLGTCPACSALVRDLSCRAERVSTLLEALEFMPEPRPVPAARWRRPALVAGMALAAALLVALALPKKQPGAPPRKPAIAAAVPAGPAAPLRSRLRKPPNRADWPASTTVRERSGHVEYYLALDDEPIESGVVVQVTLPDSGLLAEVIYDEYGRPRAVRPLN